MNSRIAYAASGLAAGLLLGAAGITTAWAGNPPGEAPALGARITQAQVTGGGMSLQELRREGRRIFSTPFNKLDGYGDGPVDPLETTLPGHRPTLQNNGTFLRVNGLDGQTCLECHSIISNATIPASFGVGGVGGAVSNAIFQPHNIDVHDDGGNGFADFDGRYINPPFLFGSGGIELVAKEMTADLQNYIQVAKDNPGQVVQLNTKGVHFGQIVFDNGVLDTSGVEGIETDLVVRPFGRKGEFPTVRAFDVGAMRFHFGMEPSEDVGDGVDNDGDGVVDEILSGELSVLHIFNTTLERPKKGAVDQQVRQGFNKFRAIGCASCHRPVLKTDRTVLPYCFPEDPVHPFENEFYSVDLTLPQPGFSPRSDAPGVVVPCFADLKRHYMGPVLGESFGSALDGHFTTARLWGVADTAPYMHDGRATTLTEAILLHGGEAETARNNFDALSDTDKENVLHMLRALRTPEAPGGGIDD